MFEYKGPIVTIVMDGIGLRESEEGNAVKLSYTPVLDKLFEKYPYTSLKAHGTAVGLPSDDDMGNSEVGHNAIGAGAVYSQGAKLVNESIESGEMYKAKGWTEIIENAKNNKSVLHFIGLFSDGNVHSHIDHLKAMIKQAKNEGINKVRVHILLDGRDVGETSALDYVVPFEEYIAALCDANFDVKIASGGGRMNITMDRYEADWSMVERGWNTHVLGEARQFASAQEAIETYRAETGVIDQDLPAFVIADDNGAVGKINDGDSVIFFNFRGDRALEISRAFEDASLNTFNRKYLPKVCYAGMLQYDGDLNIPSRFLVEPPAIQNTMGELLASKGIAQLAVAETQKFGHVTYFWNGNKSGKFDEALETYIEVKSDVVPFEQRPWMKAAEATDALIEETKRIVGAINAVIEAYKDLSEAASEVPEPPETPATAQQGLTTDEDKYKYEYEYKDKGGGGGELSNSFIPNTETDSNYKSQVIADSQEWEIKGPFIKDAYAYKLKNG